MTDILIKREELIEVFYNISCGRPKIALKILDNLITNVSPKESEDGTYNELAGFASTLISQVLDILINFKTTGGDRSTLANQATELKNNVAPFINSCLKKEEKSLHCSFCGKESSEVEKLIMGINVGICNECIKLCDEILLEEIKKESIKEKESEGS